MIRPAFGPARGGIGNRGEASGHRPDRRAIRPGPLREFIVDICTLREWTSVGELAGWFGMNTSNLQQRHLRPMLESGAPRLRHPDNPRHPEQGYRAVER